MLLQIVNKKKKQQSGAIHLYFYSVHECIIDIERLNMVLQAEQTRTGLEIFGIHVVLVDH